MDLIKDFDHGAFTLALTEILYHGEFCLDSEIYPDLHVRLTQSGKAFRGNYIRHYMPQISVLRLKDIYKQVCRGSKSARNKVSLIYRLGLGVPKDPVLSALWYITPHKGKVEMPDGTHIEFNELKSVLKIHLQAAFNTHGTSVYFSEYTNYYRGIRSYIQSDKTTGEDFIALCGSRADVIVTYVESKDCMKLAGVILFDKEKMYDISYQSMSEEIVPKTIPSKFPDAVGSRISFIGKFNTREGIYTSVDKLVHDFIDNDSVVAEYAKREASARTVVRELSQNSVYKKNLETLTSVKTSKKVFTDKQRHRITEITREVKEHTLKINEAKKATEKVRQMKNQLAGKALEFIAYDVVMPSPNTNGYAPNKLYKVVRGNYANVVSSIKALGFKTMPIAKRKPRECKNFLGIATRQSNPTVSWSKDLN